MSEAIGEPFCRLKEDNTFMDGEKTKWFTPHITVVIINVVTLLYGIELSNSFLMAESVQWIFEISHLWRHNRNSNHGKDTQGHGQLCHVWPQCNFCQLPRDSCCLPSLKKQRHHFQVLRSMYNKTIIRFDFCDTRIIKVSIGLSASAFGLGWYPLPRSWLFWISPGISQNLIQ